MKKILLLALCFAVVPVLFANQAKHERADTDTDANVSQAIRQTTLTIQSGPAQRTVFHGKPPVNPDASRALLWDQAATQYVSFAACQWDSVMAGGPFEPEICDNFVLAADATIDSVVWWGGYWNGTPAPPLDFWIKIYPDSGGGLGPMQTPIYSERVPYTETLISAADQYYYYEATIPSFAATAGVTYYIVFQPTLLYPPQYGCNVSDALWGDGNEGYFKSVYFAFPDWLPATTVFGLAYETSFQLYGTAGGPSVLTFDFEDGWQGWTNTNGDTFPFAWGVLPSGYHATWAPPDAGDSCMWIDSDAAGSGSFLLEDTVLSPVLVPNPTMDWLKYGIGYNFLSGTEYLEAGIKYFDGATWTVVPLRTYTADFGPAWDSVDVSAYAGYPEIQVYFYYTDQAGWYWYGVFDNLSIDANLGGGPVSPFWDFETGWQGWTHTSGQVFPAAWDVVETTYPGGPYWTYVPPPNAGDSAFIIDSDAAGSGTWVADTAISPAVANPGFPFCKWGFYLQYDDLEVLIREFTGSAWGSWTLVASYTGTTGPQWDSVDVSAFTGDSIQVAFGYDDGNSWLYGATFDNVEFTVAAVHDVGCTAVISPPEGSTAPADYDVIGEIWNFGGTDETFDVVANVYDTVGMVNIFTQTINLTLTAGADTNLDFGQVTFGADMHFYTEIFTMLAGDVNPSNDTSAIYSTTGLALGDVIFELDAQGVVSDNQLLGIEFDGERFYFTGAGNATDPNKVYVVDTAGTLLWTLDQPAHSTGWGWRDLAWDDVYAGPDRIDTLYASVNPNVDYFSIDLTGGNLVYHGFSPGAQSPNRALAYYPDSGWFYTANFSSSCYKFNKAGVILQTVANTYAMYGAAYDGEGDYVWWHSQDDPGTGFLCQLSQMDPYTMAFTGLVSGYALPAALTDAIAGGLCYYHGFRGNMDVLFALLQGTPNDYIVGILVRSYPGIEGKPGAELPLAFGFAPSTATVTRGHVPIAYTTNAPGHVSLKVYDNMGRLVQTLVNTHQSAGEKSIHWDNKDLSNRTVANGVYFLKLEAENQTAVHKLILVH